MSQRFAFEFRKLIGFYHNCASFTQNEGLLFHI